MDKDQDEVASRDTKVAMTGRLEVIEYIASGHKRYLVIPEIYQLD